MPRKSYNDIKRQISALMSEQQAFERKAIDTLAEAIMATDSGDQLAALSNTELQAVAKKVAAGMSDMINQVKAERVAKAVKKARAATPKPEPPAVPATPSSEHEPPEQPVQSKVLQPPPQKILPGAVPKAKGLEYRA